MELHSEVELHNELVMVCISFSETNSLSFSNNSETVINYLSRNTYFSLTDPAKLRNAILPFLSHLPTGRVYSREQKKDLCRYLLIFLV